MFEKLVNKVKGSKGQKEPQVAKETPAPDVGTVLSPAEQQGVSASEPPQEVHEEIPPVSKGYTSREIRDLHPLVQGLCREFIQMCREHQIDVAITSTYRNLDSQRMLYDQGRITPGCIVTNAKPGFSFHNYRVAFDFVPVVKGHPDWNNLHTFERCGEIAESLGLEWAGRWKSFRELAHCQYTQGLTCEDFRQGKTLKE